jgi:hypothetical protein
MKVPQWIKTKMIKIAKLNNESSQLSREVDEYFIQKGYDINLLRCGNGRSLDELDYGNDIVDQFCEWAESEFFENEF